MGYPWTMATFQPPSITKTFIYPNSLCVTEAPKHEALRPALPLQGGYETTSDPTRGRSSHRYPPRRSNYQCPPRGRSNHWGPTRGRSNHWGPTGVRSNHQYPPGGKSNHQHSLRRTSNHQCSPPGTSSDRPPPLNHIDPLPQKPWDSQCPPKRPPS